MATLKELYDKALADEDERQTLAQAASDPQALAAFFEQRGCKATLEEIRAFMKGATPANELSLDDLSAVTAGFGLLEPDYTLHPDARSRSRHW